MIHNLTKKFVYPVLLFCITVLTHVTYINNGFVWLDHIDLEEKSAILTSPWLALFSPYSQTSFYRPVLSVAHTLDAILFNQWAPGYHATNIFIHALVVILTFFLIKKLSRVPSYIAFVAAIIVALHPANTYSIGLISYRTDPLAVTFMLSAVLLVLQYRDKGLRKKLVYANWFFLLALLSKETVLLWYPLFICAILIYYKEKDRNIIINIAWSTAAVSCLFLILRNNATQSLWGIKSAQLTLSQGIGIRILELQKLLNYFVIPKIPPISDSIKITSLNLNTSLVVLSVALVLIYGVYKLRHHRFFIFFILSFIISLLPALNIIPLPRFISPHYLYFSTIIASLGFAKLLDYAPKKYLQIILTIFILWCIFTSYLSITNGPRFNNDLSFFLPEVKYDQNFREGAYYVGSEYLRQAKYELAEKYLRQASKKNNAYLSYVDSSTTANNLGLVLIQENRLEEAEPYLQQAVNEDNRATRTKKVANLALLKLRRGKPEEAIKLAESEILATKQAPVELYLILAQGYIQEKQYAKAALLLEQVKPLLRLQSEKELWQSVYKMLP